MAQLGQRTAGSRALLGSMAFLTVATAEVSHGEMAGAIRSAGHPCAHVLKIDSAGGDAWIIECNSGTFSVCRERDGRFKVTQAVGKAEK